VREKQGLSYTLGASSVPGWDPGYLTVYAATRPEDQDPTLAALLEQLKLIGDTGVTDEELSQAKRYLIGAHRMDLQRVSGFARRAALEELMGVGYDAWRHYEDRINAVTAPMVQQAAKRYLTLQQRAQAIVGPGAKASSAGSPEPSAAHGAR